ncbi:MAG: TonB-dependent receptor [bacterium]
MLRRILLGVNILVLGLTSTLEAEEREESVLTIYGEEIVVTATRVEKEIEAVPASTSVVKKKDMEKRNIKAVDEALNMVPGVYSKRTKGLMDSIAKVTLRGFPSQDRTLILMDGIPLNDAYSGSVRFAGLAPEDIEKIEVVKGPFSSLYGGYAMGGVVNIITKMPEKREFFLKSGYGSGWNRGEAMDDLGNLYFSYADKLKDKLSLFLSYGYKATKGYPTDLSVVGIKPPANITGWTETKDRGGNTCYLIGDKGDNSWWDKNFTFKTGYDFSKASKINFSFHRIGFEYNYDNPKTYLKDAAGNPVWSYVTVIGTKTKTVNESSFLSGSLGTEQNNYNLTCETKISSFKTKLTLGLVDREKYWNTVPSDTATRAGGPGKVTETPCESYNIDLQFTSPVFGRHILTFGGSFRQGWADSKDYNLTNWKDKESKTELTYQSKGKDRTYALFLQDEIVLRENLTAYLGFRQDWWKTYDGYVNQVGISGYPKYYDPREKSSFSPKAAFVYKPFEKTTLRTSIGKAFRSATISELYKTWTSLRNVTYAGNPDLKPETTFSWDVGVKQDLWKGAKIGISYFENKMDDLIYLKTVSPTYQEYINVGKAEGKGLELEVEQKFDKWLKVFSNFTYNDAKIKENEAKPATVGKRLTFMPEKMFNVGTEFEKGPFSASLTGRYMSKIYATDENKDTVNNIYTSYDPHFVADTKVSWKIKKFATLSLSIDNIFDKDYFGFWKEPGRSWFGEIRLGF